MNKELSQDKLIGRISELLKSARNQVANTVNQTMVMTYFEIGRMIVEEEQRGKERADYGKKLIADISKKLSLEFGKGFSITNIQQMRNFYLIYQKQQTLSAISEPNYGKQQTPSAEFKLSWSHYLKLMRNEAIVRYTLPENNDQIFASKYLTVLPDKEILKQLIELNMKT